MRRGKIVYRGAVEVFAVLRPWPGVSAYQDWQADDGIVAERFDEGILTPWARRTGRLDDLVHHLGLVLGGQSGPQSSPHGPTDRPKARSPNSSS